MNVTYQHRYIMTIIYKIGVWHKLIWILFCKCFFANRTNMNTIWYIFVDLNFTQVNIYILYEFAQYHAKNICVIIFNFAKL